ncbi:bifunctional DNA-binding transcriptional regulator/O6-methylguanine-DNA methyltransferase Ada [Pseudogemmobacter faecipullorum]|uniref:Bifunctional DNA-binding transcriptional regulator/O6-methylguanine-DNA methyltransferase Ada n=1 Tax=Pseudogemmobacter faecipullorum TaxID=2755041 RepID=A0ABS8CT57_9RHOB|nr:bifunctional DNA-binding transcriptional regulator/O6-methylguanine-DNA methyltransferase Ada [Pseudogemmobacter faecipullorum]MCB5411995.1 bifunctional DNA-binding transcriptional regulator/O6-methylguanine-DNA methyltransferase Ada [Pseudogemmobacter faecipullorum]
MTISDTPSESDLRWSQVLNRAGGDFVYAVRSTGVYCRPSCPSRRPKRENVGFYAGPDQAEAAGFRPCRRCHPRGVALEQANAALIDAACRRIEAAEAPVRLKDLAAEIGLSPFYLHRLFRARTGLTPKEWEKAARARRLRAGLAQGSVTGAIHAAGYATASRFYAEAEEVLGMTASAHKSGGAGEEIRFAIAKTRLGALLAAESATGICAISLGDDPAALLGELQRQFPKARLIGDDPGFAARLAQVAALVEAPGGGLDLALDLRGTAFQRQVWQALRQIPPGATLSYARLAEAVGLPKAVRAVAGACAANKLAIAVPCHRILRSDGGLSGYRWGVERKRDLLRREKDGAG